MSSEVNNLKIELNKVKEQTATDRQSAAKFKAEAEEIKKNAQQELSQAKKIRHEEEQRIKEIQDKAYNDVWRKWSFVTSVNDWIGNIWIAFLLSCIGVMVFMGNSLNRNDITEILDEIIQMSPITLIITIIVLLVFTIYLIAERPILGKIVLFLSVTITICSLALVEALKLYKNINWLKCEIPIILLVTFLIALLWDSEGRFRLTK